MEEYGRVALELDGTSLFSMETLSLVCYFQKLVEEISAYSDLCEQDDGRQCCPMWSISNYVAQWANKTDCADIKVRKDARQASLHFNLFNIARSCNLTCLDGGCH